MIRPNRRTKRRVVLLTPNYYPTEGGAERQLRTVLEELASVFDVRVVTRAKTPRVRASKSTNLQVVYVGAPVFYRRNLRLIGKALFLVGGAWATLVQRPDVVISMQLGTATTAASVASILSRSRHVIRLTGGARDGFRSEPVARAANRLALWRIYRIFGRRDVVIVAPAEHLLQDVRESFPQVPIHTTYIPNGVPTPGSLYEVNPSHRAGVLWYFRQDATVDSVRLARNLIEELPWLNFTILGRALPNSLPNVTNLGWVDDVQKVASSHLVVLNTNRFEGMPNVALQALSVGTRVLGVANPALQELAVRFPGYVTTCGDGTPGCLRARLLELLSIPGGVAQAVSDVVEVTAAWRRALS